MGFYSRYILPTVLHLSCGSKPIAYQRQKVVPRATGRVLEVGIGTGLNLPFYDPNKVDFVYGLEPASEMSKRARRIADEAAFPVKFIDLPGEEIPLDDHSVDTVLLTYTLCTIPDPLAALEGMRRVLKPDGQLLFCEHGLAPDAKVQRWQNRLNSMRSALCGGCQLNRSIPDLIEAGGFHVTDIETMYLPSTPSIAGFNYWGSARPK